MSRSDAARYVVGAAELWHGDCREIMPHLQADACVTDPPYGIGYAHGGGGAGRHSRRNSKWPIAGDDAPFDPAPLLGFESVILFGADHFRQSLPPGGTLAAWDKSLGLGPADSFADAEFIWTNLRVKRNVVRCLWKGIATARSGEEGGERYHPTMKPQAVMGQVLGWLPSKTRTVIDPYMGSGSTGVAAVRLGLRFIGIELDRGHFDVACERLERAQRQRDMVAAVFPAQAEQGGLFTNEHGAADDAPF